MSYRKFSDLRTGSRRTDEFPDFGKRLEYIERQGNTDIIVQNDKPNIQRPSGYDQYNVLQKFKWRLGSFMDFSYSFHYSGSSDIHRYDRLIEKENNVLKMQNGTTDRNCGKCMPFKATSPIQTHFSTD